MNCALVFRFCGLAGVLEEYLRLKVLTCMLPAI